MRTMASSPSLETKIIKYLQLNILEGRCLLGQGGQNPRAMQAAATALPTPVSFHARCIS